MGKYRVACKQLSANGHLVTVNSCTEHEEMGINTGIEHFNPGRQAPGAPFLLFF
jgi:hypothetical protein